MKSRDIKNCHCPMCGNEVTEHNLSKDKTIRGKSELGFEIIDYVYVCPNCGETLLICPECYGWSYIEIDQDCPTCKGMGMISTSRIGD